MSKEVSKRFDFQRKIRFLSSIPTPRVSSVTCVFCLSCTRYRSSQLLWNVIVEYFRFRSAKLYIVGSVIKFLKALGKALEKLRFQYLKHALLWSQRRVKLEEKVIFQIHPDSECGRFTTFVRGLDCIHWGGMF